MGESEVIVPAKPRVVGRYALFDEIASGGMATVHFGRLVGPVGFSRTVAIKRLHPQFSKDSEFVAMFLDEAKLASRIQHPNVVSTLDVVTLEGELFLVMEYVQGEPLSKLVRSAAKRKERVPSHVVLSVMAGVLHGLHAAHEATSEQREPLNIVHRDVSPQNVLVGTDGVARVLDFGVAKAALRSQSTQEGQMKGKLSYMSPEQLNGMPVDRRTDIFAAGVVLWEALVGKRLFAGNDAGEILAKVLTLDIPRPSQIAAKSQDGMPPAKPISRKVSDVVMKALERDPKDRYQTAREFAIALEGAGQVATPHMVGSWVEENAGSGLKRRMELVQSIESMSVDLADLSNKEETTQVDPPSSPSELTSTSTSNAGSLALTGSFEQPRRKRGWVLLSLVALGGAAAVFISQQQQQGPIGTVSSSAPMRAAPVASVEPPTVEPSASASAEPAASSSAAPVPSAVVPAPVKPTFELAPKPRPAVPVPAPTPKPKPTARPRPKVDCDPPYTIDARGIKRLKPQCL